MIDVKPAALRTLPADDVRRQVAAIIRRDDESRRSESIAALQALPQDEPVVGMALGLAQLWAGDTAAAAATLQRVKQLDGYGYYGTNADNLLHLNEAPGYPPWLRPGAPHGASVADLRARTQARPRDAKAWLALAAALENPDRSAAIAAAKRAFALDPNDVSARIAVTVLPFDKDNPGAALSGLMRVLQSSPADRRRDPRPRGLGLLLDARRAGRRGAVPPGAERRPDRRLRPGGGRLHALYRQPRFMHEWKIGARHQSFTLTRRDELRARPCVRPIPRWSAISANR